MSVVTTIVIACPAGWNTEQAEHLGHIVLEQHMVRYREEVAPKDGYDPLPDDHSGGSKCTSGHLFWLGLNHAPMDKILAALDADPQCHGAWVWYQGEFSDEPETHLVGDKSA